MDLVAEPFTRWTGDIDRAVQVVLDQIVDPAGAQSAVIGVATQGSEKGFKQPWQLVGGHAGAGILVSEQ